VSGPCNVSTKRRHYRSLTFLPIQILNYSVSKYAPPPLHLRQSLQRQYISSEASEQDLFSRVQRKLAGRKTAEVRTPPHPALLLYACSKCVYELCL